MGKLFELLLDRFTSWRDKKMEHQAKILELLKEVRPEFIDDVVAADLQAEYLKKMWKIIVDPWKISCLVALGKKYHLPKRELIVLYRHGFVHFQSDGGCLLNPDAKNKNWIYWIITGTTVICLFIACFSTYKMYSNLGEINFIPNLIIVAMTIAITGISICGCVTLWLKMLTHYYEGREARRTLRLMHNKKSRPLNGEYNTCIVGNNDGAID